MTYVVVTFSIFKGISMHPTTETVYVTGILRDTPNSSPSYIKVDLPVSMFSNNRLKIDAVDYD